MSMIGQQAPDFELEGVVAGGEFKKFRLADYKGKWLVVFFYPLDFTFICPTEILEFSRRYNEFSQVNAAVVGVSIDSKFSHKAWLKELGDLNYPLLSDITKSMSRNYDVLLEDDGIALRGTFIIDPDGKVVYELRHGLSIGRSVTETMRVLDALQSGGLCPVDWKKGEKTLG